MSGITYDYMEEYIRGLIPESEGRLKALEDFAKENGVPIAQKETIKFLEFMVSMKKPLRILELGTAIGYSAIIMHEAAGTNPHITTIERSEEMIKYAKENIESFGLSDKIKIEEGDCLEVLEKLDEPYDLIFMDAGKGHYNHFLPHCLRLLNKDGIIIADNVLFRGMVATDELVKRRKITIVKRMRTYLDLVSQDKELVTSVIPMGDGIAITKRR
ncbi:O-methyltransferase [Clostridium celatum]|mgnify:CR=1 FL=1|uniref:tRNA 5-hydroxyuridine methyltransferase n=1 Tax=Clostridium celatum DSM 1785 TaxID=545697 RepID=L1QF93_9CLOT|nr:O-methyltransferase [Clostridium celatum]EKY26669.1 O-methyltransferase [Clostridium celatum DSM 1785]MCE9653788.1 O-methyltransferase [Clostridium celatum]MDU3723033.1 O-methyltransferase [Clostridium celatum]MDU6295715.1 O-methyltransferase [Clostridium celatum]MDY3360564.1 O-methyltransferase [Clostridium celatum]